MINMCTCARRKMVRLWAVREARESFFLKISKFSLFLVLLELLERALEKWWKMGNYRLFDAGEKSEKKLLPFHTRFDLKLNLDVTDTRTPSPEQQQSCDKWMWEMFLFLFLPLSRQFTSMNLSNWNRGRLQPPQNRRRKCAKNQIANFKKERKRNDEESRNNINKKKKAKDSRAIDLLAIQRDLESVWSHVHVGLTIKLEMSLSVSLLTRRVCRDDLVSCSLALVPMHILVHCSWTARNYQKWSHVDGASRVGGQSTHNKLSESTTQSAYVINQKCKNSLAVVVCDSLHIELSIFMSKIDTMQCVTNWIYRGKIESNSIPEIARRSSSHFFPPLQSLFTMLNNAMQI